MTRKKPLLEPAPFAVGMRVTALYRAQPFYHDEVMTIIEATKVGRGKRAIWQMRCGSGRGVEGWIEASNLRLWELGSEVMAYVTAHPGCREPDVMGGLSAHDRFDVMTAIQILNSDNEILRRAPYGQLYARGTEPKCPHSHVTSTNQHAEPTSQCLNCGATRKHSAVTWSA